MMKRYGWTRISGALLVGMLLFTMIWWFLECTRSNGSSDRSYAGAKSDRPSPQAKSLGGAESQATIGWSVSKNEGPERPEPSPAQRHAFDHLHSLLSPKQSADALSFAVQDDGGRFRAQNPHHDFEIAWEASTAHVAPRGHRDSWFWSLGIQEAAVGNRKFMPKSNSVTLDSPTFASVAHEGWVEWYQNTAEGFEHGFVINRPIDQSTPSEIRVRMHLESDLEPTLSSDANTLVFKDADDRPTLSYENLLVTDARGVRQHSNLELLDAPDNEDGWDLEIVVALNDPVWPVTIDPTLVSLEITEFDVNSGGGLSGPFVVFDNNIFFIANDNVTGYELWKSDGTAAGTLLVRDITPGPASGSIPQNLRVFGDQLCFLVNDGTDQWNDLWVSDGTESGTIRLGDGIGQDHFLAHDDTALYFHRYNGSNWGLWKSDGTLAGTKQVSTEPRPSFGSSQSMPDATDSVVFDGKLYFVARDQLGEDKLWISDGTGDGTTVLLDLDNRTIGFKAAGSKLFFVADDTTNFGLWTTDGTPANTTFLTAFSPGRLPTSMEAVSNDLYFTSRGPTEWNLWKSDGTVAGTLAMHQANTREPQELTALGNLLIFKQDSGNSGEELWKSDGTVAGTTVLKDIRSGFGNGSNPNGLTRIGNEIYLSAFDGTGAHVWKSDGTTHGTVRVSTAVNNPVLFTSVGSEVFFRGYDSTTGNELWKTDGTAAGTQLVREIGPEATDPDIAYLTNLNGTLLFRADDDINGWELWRSDGTDSGTWVVKDIARATGPFAPEVIAFNNNFFFAAPIAPSSAFTRLWRSDGSAAGTVQLRFGYNGLGLYPSEFCVFAGDLYFQGDGALEGRELWRTDGTTAGTELVKDVRTGSGGSAPSELTVVGNELFFAANGSSTEGRELWKTDGTAAGTVLIKDIRPGSSHSDPKKLTAITNLRQGTDNLGPRLFFQAHNGTDGVELWVSDGTEAGTVLVKNINPGSFARGSFPDHLIEFNQNLFFTAITNLGEELWVSDGTSSGTVQVKNIRSGLSSSLPENLTVAGNTLYFIADDGSTGRELWKTDGTSVGTQQVIDIQVGSGSAFPEDANLQGARENYLMPFGTSLIFAANDGIHGRELWKTDGTAANTVLVKDIFTGSGWSNPMGFAPLDGELYFQAATAATGAELWKTDGTESGTVPFENIADGMDSAFPNQVTPVGSTVFYFAEDNTPASFGLRVLAQQFTLTVVAGPNGSVEGGGPFFTGTAAPITATPDAGFLFSHWTGAGVADPTIASTTVGITGDLTVTANFAPIRELALSVIPLGAGTVTGQGQYPDGAIASISAMANAGFQFSNWGGGGVTDPSASSTTVSMTQNRSLTAHFDVVHELTLVANPTSGGIVTGSGSIVSGTEAPIMAVPNPGYRFDGWSGPGVVDTDSLSTTVLVDQAKTVTANFAKTWDLVAKSAPFGGGVVTGSGTFDEGSVTSVSVAPHPGYVFLGWIGDGISDASALTTTVSMTSDRSVMANFTERTERLGDAGILSYGDPQLLADSVVLGDQVLYRGYDPINGVELWTSDGTPQGTHLLLDIYPDGGSYPHSFTVLGGKVFFRANHPDYGRELWETDGTPAGTKLFLDSLPGPNSSPNGSLTSSGDLLFFAAPDSNGDSELGISDGTLEGTFTIDLNPSTAGNPNRFEAAANGVFFRAHHQAAGDELWFSDGTVAGTQLLKDIRAGSNSSSIVDMTVFGDKLLFRAFDTTHGYEPWLSDGTPVGTQLIKDINPGFSNSNAHVFVDLGNGTALFAASQPSTGYELWRTDGTPAGTQLVKDINPGSGSSVISHAVALNGNMLFLANDGVSGSELWISNGTGPNTFQLKDIQPGAGSGNPSFLFRSGDEVFFSAAIQGSNHELWKTDGTAVGSQLVKEIRPGSGSSELRDFIALGTEVLFRAQHPTHGYELWKSDGTEAGTVLVKDAAALGPSRIHSMLTLGNELIFSSQGDGLGQELWKSDGSAAGTNRLKDIHSGSSGSNPHSFINNSGEILFAANDSVLGYELWETDGTEAGTLLVKDIRPGAEGSGISWVERHGNELLFSASDGAIQSNSELWKSDGTSAGTVKILEINATGNSSPTYIRSFGSHAYFRAHDGSAHKLWKTDGTAAGTSAIANIFQQSESVEAGGNLFFPASDNLGTYGSELWKVDTSGVASLVKDITSGTIGTSFLHFHKAQALNGNLLFSGPQRHLWISDGSEGGTELVRDIVTGSEFLTLGEQLFFVGDDPTQGEELWVSDGTTAGTRLLKDIRPGADGSVPREFATHDGLLYFSAYTPTYGREVWVSDGTEAGTVLYEDIVEGFGSSNPTSFYSYGSGLYYFAHDDETGAYGLRTLQPDTDGVSEIVEENAPNDGDGNNDGLQDSEQSYVTSLPIADDGSGGAPPYVTLETSEGSQLANVEAIENPAPSGEAPPVPDESELPIGFLEFSVTPPSANPGFSTTVEILLPPGVTANQYWKFGAEPENLTPHWYPFTYDSTTGTGAVFEPGKITLHLIDGQRGDGDLTANGVIVDPGAAIFVTQYTLTLTANPSAGGSVMGGGTYFVDDDAAISANPAVGYRFLDWVGQGVADPQGATTTVKISSNDTITASFGLDSTAGYRSWAALAFPGRTDGNVIGPFADADGDGQGNLLEYAFVTDPNRSDSVVLESGVQQLLEASYLEGEFRARASDLNLLYQISIGNDPGQWTDIDITFDGSMWLSSDSTAISLISQTDEGSGVWRIRVRDEQDATRRFMAIKASER